ncbi:MAG: DNA translocase FtsK [Alphaproteobacteria bacterium]|nr:DNA translocase FtsK [Alphaproteobacteria bacterium]
MTVLDHSQRTRLFPPGTMPYLRRRALEFLGGAVAALALWLALALLSFDRADPSFNVLTDRLASNLAGRAGAYAADVALQAVGYAAAFAVLIPLGWSWRLMSAGALARPRLRVLLLPLVLVLAALAFASIPWLDAGPLGARPGGMIGAILAARFATLVPAGGPLVAAIAGALALALAAVGLGLTAGDWLGIGRGARHAARQAGRLIAGLIGRAQARDETLDDEPIVARTRIEPRLGDIATLDPSPAPARDKEERPKPRITERPAPRRARQPKQASLDLETTGAHQLPPLDLLSKAKSRAGGGANDAVLDQNARQLESVLDDFGIKGQITRVSPGPVVTLYELEPEPGIRSSRVISLADDIARSMSAISARVAVIPGRNAIGIELPNSEREVVSLRDLLAAAEYEQTAAELTLALGKDISGKPVIVDLARMPHLLVAGTTGSGKSVAINSMILSLLYRLPPERCRFIMIDPKMLELSVYDDIPHLLSPVVTEAKKAVVALKWAVREMENRYRLMSKVGVRNIAGFNKRLAEATANGETLTRTVQTGFDPETGQPILEDEVLASEPLPLIVVIVDEMADLMLLARNDIEVAIQRLAQMARAAGIHLIMATQRPSVDVITGTIKANFPSRVSFQVTSKIDSRTILGEQGAEQLLGQGDMLYMAGSGRITRIHGPYVSEGEVEKVVAFLKRQGVPDYVTDVTVDPEEDAPLDLEEGSGDTLYDQAVALVIREGKASTSFVQRHLMIGYNRAARLIERMENEGVVSRADRVGKREVLVPHGGN